MKFVATLAFTNNGGFILMVKKRTKKLPHLNGRWNGVGGKMEAGESPVGAAMREFTEETGIIAAKDDMVFVEHQRFINGVGIPGGRYCERDEIYWYTTILSGGRINLPAVNDAGEELRWMRVEEEDMQVEPGFPLCPNLDYLIPKAIVFLRTPYLDLPS
jgi:8-oxo-dGTP pyrophosphatase MutT (NUDIX family)